MAGNRKNRHVRHPRRVRLTRPALGKGNVHGSRRFPSGRWWADQAALQHRLAVLIYLPITPIGLVRPRERRVLFQKSVRVPAKTLANIDHWLVQHTLRPRRRSAGATRDPLIPSAKAAHDCAICAERMPRDRQPSGLNTTIRKEKTCRSLSETTMLNRLSAP